MILQTFLQVNNIACAIYCEISLNIVVGYCRIECTTSGVILKPICVFLLIDKVFILVVIIFTHDTFVK